MTVPQWVIVTVVAACHALLEPGDPLAQTRLTPVPVLLGIGQLMLGAFPARVLLDPVVDRSGHLIQLVVVFDCGDVLHDIVAVVKAQ